MTNFFWQARKKPIRVLLTNLQNKYNLKWLRISMSYHKFPNLREIFQGDLASKLMEGVQSKDFMDRACNCNKSTKDEEGHCIYGGQCRKSIVIYKATCKECDKVYIGNTQQKVKKRLDQHFGDTVRLANCGEKSDSFASHFAEHFKQSDEDVRRKHVREMVKMEILWQGDAISCMKSFGQLNCHLCMRERIEILKWSKKNLEKLINSRSEIYGACRHKTRFHRYCMNGNIASTDEGLIPEKALGDISNASWPEPPPGDPRACQLIEKTVVGIAGASFCES